MADNKNSSPASPSANNGGSQTNAPNQLPHFRRHGFRENNGASRPNLPNPYPAEVNNQPPPAPAVELSVNGGHQYVHEYQNNRFHHISESSNSGFRLNFRNPYPGKVDDQPPSAAEFSVNGGRDQYLHKCQNYRVHDIPESSNNGFRLNLPNPSTGKVDNQSPPAPELSVDGGHQYQNNRFPAISESSNSGSRLNPNSIEYHMRRLSLSSAPPPINCSSIPVNAENFYNGLSELSDGESLLNRRIRSAARITQNEWMQYTNSPNVGGNRDAFHINGNLNSVNVYGFYNGNNTSIAAVAPTAGYNHSPGVFTYQDPRIYGNPANLGHYSRVLESNPFPNITSVENGNIYLASTNFNGRWSVCQKLEGGNPQNIATIFEELKDHVHELMKHQYGHTCIQKLFEVCSEAQMAELLRLLLRSEFEFMSICTHALGSRVMSKLLANLKSEQQRVAILKVFSRNVISLTNYNNGHQVIMSFLSDFPSEICKPFARAVAANYYRICIDKNGCCIIQKIIECVCPEDQQLILYLVVRNAVPLSEDQYGNYVVQHVLGLRMPTVTSAVVKVLTGRFVPLSTNKYASNVVQKCFQNAGPDLIAQMMKELMDSKQIMSVIQNAFGNYVVQTALQESKGKTRDALMKYVNEHSAQLLCNPFGRKVLEKAREFRRPA